MEVGRTIVGDGGREDRSRQETGGSTLVELYVSSSGPAEVRALGGVAAKVMASGESEGLCVGEGLRWWSGEAPAVVRHGFVFDLLFSSLLFIFDASRLCDFAGGIELARVTSTAPRWLFDFAPWTIIPSCRIGSYNILIGSNNGSSMALKLSSNNIRGVGFAVSFSISFGLFLRRSGKFCTSSLAWSLFDFAP
ncbi:hypothetical protein KFK09_006668 [Dendrobium nobile]|uniref:Uncharacterized protein n=1 Tax=Dendrobium nobile TaxID=94219 RepID=A0A8T3BT19_DENNO|nr:hypothetical protein KFK09_006668 [Dendrobium nobile]